MARRRHTLEQSINILLKAEVGTAEASTVDEASRRIEVTEQTLHRWRS